MGDDTPTALWDHPGFEAGEDRHWVVANVWVRTLHVGCEVCGFSTFFSSSDPRRNKAAPAYAEHLDFAWSIGNCFDIMRWMVWREKLIARHLKN
jgi:hypothetical protein